jgi:hypothetical protein
MTHCCIGRIIVHEDVETHPGYQDPCPRPGNQIMCVGGGRRVERHPICDHHADDLYLRGLISQPLPVAVPR